MTWIQNVAGSIGSAIDRLPGRNQTGSLFGNPWVDVSATLQNWGGNAGSSLGSAIVKPASADTGGGGSQSGYSTFYDFGQGDVLSNQSTQDTSGGGGGGGGQPSGDGGGGGGPDPFLQALENTFNPIMSSLNRSEQLLREQQPGIIGGIQSQFATSQDTLETERDIGQRQLGEAREGTEQREEDALNAARRLFNEMRTGGRQRFGAASPIGEGFQALLGREFAQNRQNVFNQTQQAMRQIQSQAANLQQRYSNAVLQLETQKNEAVRQARNFFQNKLAEIDRQRDVARSEKAQAKLGALQDLRNQLFQIDLAQAEAKNQVDGVRQQMQSQIQSVAQGILQNVQAGQGAAQGAMANTTVDPTSGLLANAAPQGGQAGFNPTGFINPNDEEQMFGIRQPTRADEEEALA